jgi:hypothetical protein
MDDSTYLSKIIDCAGDCTSWTDDEICKNCPLSKLIRRASGGYLSCTEAVGVIGLSQAETNIRYVAIAALLLLDINIEELLLDSHDTK